MLGFVQIICNFFKKLNFSKFANDWVLILEIGQPILLRGNQEYKVVIYFARGHDFQVSATTIIAGWFSSAALQNKE